MNMEIVEPSREAAAELTAFLDDRIYEFNVQATGLRDGRPFAGVVRDDRTAGIIAAIDGHTWGGCCHIVHLWVHESHRGRGIGGALLQAAEAEAIRRGCSDALLSTHSFQAPAFYERRGYVRHATVPDYPRGHAQHVYLKHLGREVHRESAGVLTAGKTTWRPDPNALRGRIAVVAGATRGAGRGIAAALGEAGATVFCTGRSSRSRALQSDYDRPETIEETAELVTSLGGNGIPVVVDHLDISQVRKLANRIQDAHGHIDILVNDIWGAEQLKGGPPDWNKPIWQLDLQKGFRILRLAVDTHLITSHHLLPLLIRRPGGLLVEVTDGTSEYNASRYRLSVFYDLAKAGVNRLAFSQGHELAPHQATAVALTPGWLRSEMMLDAYKVTEDNWRAAAAPPGFAVSESPRYVGRAVAALAADPARHRWNQRSMTSAQLAAEYGFTDIDGSRPDVWRYNEAIEAGTRDVRPNDYR